MKFIRATSTAAALLFFGTSVSVYAQREGGEKAEERQAPQQEKQAPQHAQQPQQRAPQAAPQQHAAQPRPQEQQRGAQPKQQEQSRAPQPNQQEQQRAAQPKPQEQQRAAQPRTQEQQRVAAQPRPQEQQRAQQPATQQHAQQTDQARQQVQPQRTQQQARSWQQQKGWQQGGGSQGHATFAQDRSQNWSSEHRTWGQRGGYGGYYIPQDRFNVSFGSQHFFRLGVLPVMYLGYPQFSYGGFSFLMVDPWPGDWGADWYANDDVYIGFNDGYYLYDRRYPQEAVAISIQL